jgi:hypothetical protein
LAQGLWILLLVCWGAQLAYGAPALSVGIRHSQGAKQAFDGIEGLNVAQIETQLNFPLAMRSSPAGLWVQGLQFTEHRFVLTGALDAVRRLYRLSLPLEYYPRTAGRWQYGLGFEPAYNTDETLFQQKRFVFEYSAAARYRVNKKVTWVMGFNKDSRFGGKRLYPIFGLEARPNKRWHHHWVYPDIHSEVKIKRNTFAKVFMRPSGGQWRYLQADSTVASLSITDWNTGVSLRQKTASPLFFRIELGTRMMGTASVAGQEGGLDNALYFLVSLEAQLEQ